MIGALNDRCSGTQLMDFKAPGKTSVPSQDSAADRLASTRALLSMDKAVRVDYMLSVSALPVPVTTLLSQLEMFNASC